MIKVGDTLYRFDGNRRVYDKAFGSGPIYREHFEPMKIIGETPRSWVLEKNWKASKKDLKSAASMQYGGRGFFTAEGMEDDIWQHEHRYKVSRLVEQASPATLKLVAKVVGYQPNK